MQAGLTEPPCGKLVAVAVAVAMAGSRCFRQPVLESAGASGPQRFWQHAGFEAFEPTADQAHALASYGEGAAAMRWSADRLADPA